MTNYNNPFGYNQYPQMPYVPPYSPYKYGQQNTYAFVNGIEGAKSYIMQPNQTVLLMDSDSPMCYMKQSNNVGQASIRSFKLVEVTEPSKDESVSTEYVLKSDFDILSKKIDELSNKLEGSK